MELYVSPETAEEIIKISKSFSVDAKIIGRVEKSQEKKITLVTKYGTFEYPN
jgi:phosphoribosylformylglycinamidine cyclo-ligase